MVPILNDLDRIREIDKHNMLEVIEKSPRFMKWCIDTYWNDKNSRMKDIIIDLRQQGSFKGVFIVGMGGSAISGDVIVDWLRDLVKMPIFVIRGYKLPAFIDSNYLGVFLSYSGNTEETLSCFLDARSRKIVSVGITSGGLLENFLKLSGNKYILVPSGYQPRAAFLYLFTTLALLMIQLISQPVESLYSEIEETNELLEELRGKYAKSIPIEKNPAKSCAMKLFKTIIAVYGFDHLTSVARRFKGQFNENGKNPAYHDSFSELNHNETVGWEISPDVSSNISCIILRDDRSESDPIKVRIDYTKKIIEKKANCVVELHATGKSRLARMLSLIFLGDFISTYLAILNDKDPTPVNYIQGLKDELKQKINMQKTISEKMGRFFKGSKR
ncbi:MAG: bifunctional phosphoglucose/phosphomannose isomerase [Promethearchaeota archaeon]